MPVLKQMDVDIVVDDGTGVLQCNLWKYSRVYAFAFTLSHSRAFKLALRTVRGLGEARASLVLVCVL